MPSLLVRSLYYLTFPAGKPVWLVEYRGTEQGQHIFTADNGEVLSLSPDTLHYYRIEPF